MEELLAAARELRARATRTTVSYSPKVFLPLTKACRDVCHYCTFARAPLRGQRVYLRGDEVLQIAAAGARAGCIEALFTLGDKPELRHGAPERNRTTSAFPPRSPPCGIARGSCSRRPACRRISTPASWSRASFRAARGAPPLAAP